MERMVFNRHCCNPKNNVVLGSNQLLPYPYLAETYIIKYDSLLRQKARNWEFRDTEDYMLEGRIVFIVTDKRLKEQLLRELGLSLQK